MNVSALHQTKHLECVATDVPSLEIKLSAERLQSRHDVGDGSITVVSGMRRFSLLSLCPNAGICFFDHLLAEINANQIVLEYVVVKHVFGSFAQIHNPFSHR